MSVQTPQQIVNYLQGQVYMWAIIAVVGLISFTVTAGLWFWRNRSRTKVSKTIDSAKGKSVHLLIAASLGSFAKLWKAREFSPEGVLETKSFDRRDKGKDRRRLFGPPRRAEVPSALELKRNMDFPDGTPEDVQLKAAELTREMAQVAIDLTNRKIILEGVGVPVSVVVDDKVVTVGIKGLGALAFYQKLERIQSLGTKIKLLMQTDSFKDIGETLLALASKISFVDFDLIRAYFDESYDQSNQEAQDEWNYMAGYRKGVASVKKDKEMGKMYLYMGLGIGIAGIVGGVALAFVGK